MIGRWMDARRWMNGWMNGWMRASTRPRSFERESTAVGGVARRVAMTLWTLTQSALLAVNAVAVLNERRFLAPRGLTMRDVREGGTTSPTSAKGQMVGLINAASYLRVPLVVLNSIVIFVKVVFG